MLGKPQLEQAIAIIEANPALAFFAGPRGAELLAQAEQALGEPFPPLYRSFVQQFGAGSFGAFEVYGVIGNDLENGTVPDGVWLTLNERVDNSVVAGIMLIGSTGDGGYYSLQLGPEDGPVSIIWAGSQRIEPAVADDFGSFLLNGVQEQA